MYFEKECDNKLKFTDSKIENKSEIEPIPIKEGLAVKSPNIASKENMPLQSKINSLNSSLKSRKGLGFWKDKFNTIFAEKALLEKKLVEKNNQISDLISKNASLKTFLSTEKNHSAHLEIALKEAIADNTKNKSALDENKRLKESKSMLESSLKEFDILYKV